MQVGHPIWRTRAAYLAGGLEQALYDEARPGRPRRYDTDAEARITVLACSTPPPGHKRWTVVELEQAARVEPGLQGIGRETIRRRRSTMPPSPTTNAAMARIR